MDQDFLSDLVAKFDLGDYPVNEQEQILDEMSQIIMESSLVRAIPLLPAEAAIRYDTMIAGDSDIADVFAFLRVEVPGFDDIVSEEVATLEKALAKPHPSA